MEAIGSSERIPELDGLRGLAIFLVILCHYVGDPPHGASHSWQSRIGGILSQGAVGVDLFFILSGFLIGGILLNSKASPWYYRTFYLRRFHRIIPLYHAWIMLFGILWLVAKRFGGSEGAEFRTLTPYWAYFIFIQNYFLRSNTVQSFWLIPTWSLAVEEQFYLVAPPLVRNLSPRGLAILMAAILPLSLLLRFCLADIFSPPPFYWGTNAAYLWTPCRADELALGVLTAIIWANPHTKQWVLDHVRYFYSAMTILATVLLLLTYWLLLPNSFMLATFGRTSFGLFFVCLMILLLVDRQSVLARIFRVATLRELGKISYCVYIIHEGIHWTLFKLIRHDLPRFDSWPAFGVAVLALAVTICIAELSWRFFEHPLIRRGHRYTY